MIALHRHRKPPRDPQRGSVRRATRRAAARLLVASLLLVAAPHPRATLHAPGGPAAWLGPATAHAGTAADLVEKAREKERIRRLLAPYDREVRRAIRKEYKRLGKDPGDIERAIDSIVNKGGGGNSAIKRDAFAQTVYPIVRDYCRDCHSGSGPGFPSIAHSQVTTAYDAVVANQKVRLSDPNRSRLVQRLSNDRHYCWSDCQDDADDMQAAIEEWAAIEESLGDSVDVASIVTTGSTMAEGKVDKQKGRIVDHVIARWEFKEGEGEIAHDTSGVEPAMDLRLRNAIWMSNWGLQFDNRGWAMADPETSKKLYRRIAHPQKGTQQYSIEAWVAPANTDQDGPARIVSYSDGTEARNFTLGQNLYNYVFRNRNTSRKSERNGTPDLQTADDDQDAQAVLQHVVVTYDRFHGRKIFVNGRFTGDEDPVKGDLLFNWSEDFPFIIGNETTNNRPWRGQVRYVAIHEIALSKKQIKQNFKEGVGQRFLVRFGLDDWLTTTGNYVEFSVKEFDGYSYLFCEPSFSGPPPLDYRVGGIRIAVNGVRAVSGQAFTNVETIVTSEGKSVSRLCSVIPKDQGVESDRFSIYFERLGDFQNVFTEDPPVIVTPEDDLEVRPRIAVRTFDQVNFSMSALTGVSPLTPAVRNTFQEIRQQLPATFDARSFLASHQVAIAKLALDYCDAMVETPALRNAVFGTAPAFEFDQPVPTAFSTQAKRDQIANGLFDRMVGAGLLEQPTRAETLGVVDALIGDLTNGCDAASCPAERTRTVVKAACASVLSSAAVTVH